VSIQMPNPDLSPMLPYLMGCLSVPGRHCGPHDGPPAGHGGGLPLPAGPNVRVEVRGRGGRSPGALWPLATLESVGSWPMAIATPRFLGGAAPR
jgi:hypothetical protein